MKTLPNDISRCINANCPLKNDCLRWTDKGKGLVWYSHFEPENNKCKEQIKKITMDTLKDIFVSYEIAEKLKEIGFDEPCIGYYEKENPHIRLNEDRHKTIKHNGLFLYISAPTHDQVFKWFREKMLIGSIFPTYLGNTYFFEMFRTEANTRQRIYIGNNFKTYEQAREELILKLIEIYKNEQDTQKSK